MVRYLVKLTDGDKNISFITKGRFLDDVGWEVHPPGYSPPREKLRLSKKDCMVLRQRRTGTNCD